ncbi:MAG: TonB-dependent receptor [Ignavibacteriae bacterium]|nr:TonB-dependent receptor [Ignavibacteriota bacterium]
MKNIYTILYFFFFPVFLFSAFLSVTLSAQEKEKEDSLKYQTEELVITGTRTFDKIIDIPYSVFRVDKKELGYGKKVSAKDVLADVPGLYLQSRYGNHDLRISIRGFGTRSNTGVRGVRILQDGIPESEPDGETVIDAVDFTSLGGVEVVKGNLSSLYANAPGGVINFLTDMYFPKNFFTSNNQIGKYGYRQNGIKAGVKTNDYRYFLSYNYKNLDGFRVHSNEYTHIVNSVFEGYLGTKTTISVLGNYVRGLNKIPGSLTPEEFTEDPFQARDIAISQDFRNETQKGRLGVKFLTSFGKYNNNEIEATIYGGIKELIKTNDADYTIATRYSLGSLIRFTNRSEILKRNNKFTIGMDYAYQSGPRTVFDNINGHKGNNVNDMFEDDQGSIGFYFQNQFNLVTNKMDLFLSGRFDRNVFSKSSLQFRGFTDTSRIFQEFTPKIALNYKLTPSVALYTSYGIGYDVPSVYELDNNYTTSNTKYTMNPDLAPQKSNNFELGIKGNLLNKKSEFMRKLFFETTFFDYVIADEIVPYTINQTTYYRNAAKSNRKGIEVGIMSEPLEGIELTVNYTFTNFKYDEYNAIIFGPSGTTYESYAGNREPSVPQHILNLILNFEFEINENFNGLLQWDCDYITNMYVDDKNTVNTPLYFYGNAMAGINATFGKFGCVAFVGMNNIFDKRYVGFVNINDYYGRYFETGEPRNLFSGLNVSFRY